MTPTRRGFLTLAAGGFALAGGLARAFAQSKIKPGPQDLLLVVDVQNCFTPGGSLAVNDGDKIIPIINRLAPGFEHVILTLVGPSNAPLLHLPKVFINDVQVHRGIKIIIHRHIVFTQEPVDLA